MMNLFIGIGMALLLAATAFILIPLLRKNKDRSKSSLALNRQIFESKVRDLKEEKASGALSDAAYSALVHELERDLLSYSTSDTTSEAPPRHQMATVLTIATLIPVASIFLYLTIGNPAALSPQGIQHPVNISANKEASSIPEMIERLEKRLKETPDDAQGWVFLGRTYGAAGRVEDSVKAYHKAKALAGNDPNILADLAESIAVLHSYSMAGEPSEYIEQVLRAVPDHPKGLWLGGTAAFQTQDYKLALDRWIKLLGQLPPQGEDTGALREYIQNAIDSLPKNQQQAYLDKVPAPLPPIAAEEEPSAMASAGVGTSINVSIRLAPSIQSQAKPDDIVFVFARAVDGPKAPLAITKLQVKDLPTNVTLDESMAMVPAMTLAKFDKVIVGARISKSGQPIASSGDIEGLSDVVVDRSKVIDIEIAKTVP